VATAYPTVGGSYWHFDRLVSGKVASIELSASAGNVTVGDTLQLTPAVRVDGVAAGTYTIDWSTNNSSVATVSSSGLVTAQAGGQVTVTATLTGWKTNRVIPSDSV